MTEQQLERTAFTAFTAALCGVAHYGLVVNNPSSGWYASSAILMFAGLLVLIPLLAGWSRGPSGEGVWPPVDSNLSDIVKVVTTFFASVLLTIASTSGSTAFLNGLDVVIATGVIIRTIQWLGFEPDGIPA